MSSENKLKAILRDLKKGVEDDYNVTFIETDNLNVLKLIRSSLHRGTQRWKNSKVNLRKFT